MLRGLRNRAREPVAELMTLNRTGLNQVLTQSKVTQRIKQLKLKGRFGKSWALGKFVRPTEVLSILVNQVTNQFEVPSLYDIAKFLRQKKIGKHTVGCRFCIDCLRCQCLQLLRAEVVY